VIGWVKAVGSLHHFRASLEVAIVPKLGGGLHHSRKRAIGHQTLSLQFHAAQ